MTALISLFSIFSILPNVLKHVKNKKLHYLFGIVRTVCGAGFMYLAANFSAVARSVEDIDRLLHGAQQPGVWRANAGRATLSA